jgi:hypothetical protein
MFRLEKTLRRTAASGQSTTKKRQKTINHEIHEIHEKRQRPKKVERSKQSQKLL